MRIAERGCRDRHCAVVKCRICAVLYTDIIACHVISRPIKTWGALVRPDDRPTLCTCERHARIIS
jgi:hypothetical protein